jgi:hypothetical protein
MFHLHTTSKISKQLKLSVAYKQPQRLGTEGTIKAVKKLALQFQRLGTKETRNAVERSALYFQHLGTEGTRKEF